jgi:hypothetical protein
MDVADALHPANGDGYTTALSFDRPLAKLAKTSGAIPVEGP